MVKTVLVPLDGSREAEQALPFGRLIAGRHDATLKLMSVIEVSAEFDAWVETAPFSLEDEVESWLAERREYLGNIAEAIGDGVEFAVRVGRPADEIRAVAEESDDVVVVMASHGRGGLQQLVLGSVALKVIHDVRCPVIAVHIQDGDAAAPVALNRVLLPVDGSDFSKSIFGTALDVIGEPPPALHLVRVTESPVWGAESRDAGLVGQYLESTREMNQQQLEELAGDLRGREYEASVELRDGRPGDEILSAATQTQADMIAMATHGRGGIGRLLLGSVAQRVLQRAELPLLLIRPQSE